MPYSLKGRSVLITGGSRGLGAVIAHKFAAEGCNLCINYVSNADAARDLAAELVATYSIQATTVSGDCGVASHISNCIAHTVATFGGLDIIIGNAGWTKFAPFSDLDALSEEDWDRCWAVNVKGPHALVRDAMPIFRENPEGGVVIFTGSVAGVSLTGSSLAYSVTKAAQVHLMKGLAVSQGPKVRINAVLPGLLLTEWGMEFGEERIAKLREAAVLGRETELSECADAYVMLAKNTSMTGQTVQVDSGLVVANM